MNVYDFDNTLFRGDSTARFLIFCARRYPRVWRHAPSILGAGALFLLGKVEKTAFKQKMFEFLQDVPDVDEAVNAFWQKNARRVRAWYKAQRQADDVIISASPEFLLAPIAARLGARLIASRVDPGTGLYDGENCHGAEKVRRFRIEFGDTRPDAFYSDSRSDEPMARLARQAYLVRGDSMRPWDESAKRRPPF